MVHIEIYLLKVSYNVDRLKGFDPEESRPDAQTKLKLQNTGVKFLQDSYLK
jgi:hypothetical protein